MNPDAFDSQEVSEFHYYLSNKLTGYHLPKIMRKNSVTKKYSYSKSQNLRLWSRAILFLPSEVQISDRSRFLYHPVLMVAATCDAFDINLLNLHGFPKPVKELKY